MHVIDFFDEKIGRLLTREVQATAALNKAVGKNIMCTMIPRPYGDSASKLTYRFVIPPPFDTPTFVYISGEGNALPCYGPVLVGPECVLPSMSIDEVNITMPPVEQILGSQEDTPV